MTWAALSSWWMLSSSVPMSRRCCHSVLKLFLRMAFASLQDMGCADCFNLLPIFDSRSASSLPPTPQWEGIHWRVTDVLFLSRDNSCLMLLKIWSPPGDWRLCRMDRQSKKQTNNKTKQKNNNKTTTTKNKNKQTNKQTNKKMCW